MLAKKKISTVCLIIGIVQKYGFLVMGSSLTATPLGSKVKMDIKEFLITDNSKKVLSQLKGSWLGLNVFDDKILIKLQNGNTIKIEITSKDIAEKFECFSLVISNSIDISKFEETNIFKTGVDKITVLPRYEWIEEYIGKEKFIGNNPVQQNIGKKSQIPQNAKIICKVEDCIFFENKGESLNAMICHIN